MNEVERFIAKFQNPESIEMFSGDCSYWFAVILHRRFIRNGAKVVFSSDMFRFGTSIGNKVYGIDGEITDDCEWVSWVEFTDLEAKDRITRQKILF